MIIHSKFSDYYDSALMHGHDATRRYIRKSETIEHDKGEQWFNVYPSLRSSGYTQTPFYVGFCGRVYAGLRLQYGYKSFDRTFYTADDLERYVYRIADPHLRRTEVAAWEQSHYYWRTGRKMTSVDAANEFFDSYEETNMFFELGTPVFLVTYKEITVNPNLGEIEFYKMYPPHQAFQEIDMYLSGVLGNAHPPMVQISDENMRDKKGFDEWSFKTRPTKRL